MFNQTKKFILDTLFPITCLSCGAPDEWFCEKCLAGIKIITRQVCPYCEKVHVDAGKFCPACLASFKKKNKNPPLDGLIVSAKYAGVSFLVHKFKYAFVKDLSFVLGKIIVEGLRQNDISLPNIVIPVPLYSRRERWRGFNQAALLAENVAENLLPNCPLPVGKNILTRKKHTHSQMKIKDYSERQKNISNAFALNSNALKSLNTQSVLTDKTVLLIDDVSTTGATLLECARILKSAGAKKVFAGVIARQEIKTKS